MPPGVDQGEVKMELAGEEAPKQKKKKKVKVRKTPKADTVKKDEGEKTAVPQ